MTCSSLSKGGPGRPPPSAATCVFVQNMDLIPLYLDLDFWVCSPQTVSTDLELSSSLALYLQQLLSFALEREEEGGGPARERKSLAELAARF